MSGEDRNPPEVTKEEEIRRGGDPRYSLLTGETGELWVAYARGWNRSQNRERWYAGKPMAQDQRRAFNAFWEWLEGKEGKER